MNAPQSSNISGNAQPLNIMITPPASASSRNAKGSAILEQFRAHLKTPLTPLLFACFTLQAVLANASPSFSSSNSGGSINFPVNINSATQVGVRDLSLNAPRLTYVAGQGYSTRLSYTQTGIVNNGTSLTGLVTLADDQPTVNGSYSVQSGDTFYIVRTDGHLWPSTGTKGQLSEGVVVGSSAAIFVGLGVVTNGFVLTSEIVTGTGGFIRSWFGDGLPQGTGVWKNNSGDSNWSSNATIATSNWGGTQGTTNWGKPGDAGQIATFNGTVTNYNGGAVNQDVLGLRIGGMSLSDSGSGGFSITGSAIDLDNGSRLSPINVASGVHSVATPLTVLSAGISTNVAASTDKVTLSGGITATGTTTYVAGTNNKTLLKTGQGSLVLAGTNAFSGGTTVQNGNLEVADSLSGVVNINAGAMLSGGGTVSGLATVTGTLSPGLSGPNALNAGVNSVATLNAGAGASFADGSTFKLDLQLPSTGGSDTGVNDKLNVTGAISLFGTTTIELSPTGGYVPALGDMYFVVINDESDPINGAPEDFVIPDFGGLAWEVYTEADSLTGSLSGGNDIAIQAVVPEPSALTMLMGSLSLAAGLQRFRRRNGHRLQS